MLDSRNGVMCPVMEANCSILIGLIGGLIGGLLVCTPLAAASPEDDQVGAYLKANDMTSLLEVQLEDRIRNAKSDSERSQLAKELSAIYLDQLRSTQPDDPYRQIILMRAQSLLNRMTSVELYELQIELYIEAYLGVEHAVELSRLQLLEPDRRQAALDELSMLHRELKLLASRLDPEVAQLERSLNRSSRASEPDRREELQDLRRYRSLSHYYHAWTGYSRAVLRDQQVPSDVLVSFGWLLGAKGDMPQLALFNETSLEFDHVARSAIGVALSYAHSGDTLSARSWVKLVARSQYAPVEVSKAADERLLEILALDRDWTAANEHLMFVLNQRGEDTAFRVSLARFLALNSLAAIDSSKTGRGGEHEAQKMARFSVELLVEQGEIGHVLDLYRRFDSLPMVADSFILYYAQALTSLSKNEQSGRDGMYASVAAEFAAALDSPDADRFPSERDDCVLKLAYCEIRSGRDQEAIKQCDRIIAQSSLAESIQEARWMRIAALDSINAKSGKTTSKLLEQAVREFIIAYPETTRSAQLIIRHAMQGAVDAQIAIDTLSSIDASDPIAIPVRRALVRLMYQRLLAGGYTDQLLIEHLLSMVHWLIDNESQEIPDLNTAKAQLGTIRIGLDVSLRSDQPDVSFVQRLIEHGMIILVYDETLAAFRSELVYRQFEIAVQTDRSREADELLLELIILDQSKAENARILMFNSAVRSWKTRKSKQLADRIVNMGAQVLAKQTPAYPQEIGLQVSAIAEVIADAAMYLWTQSGDEASRALAMRVSLLVLERGQVSEAGLRRTAYLSKEIGDKQTELDAWLRLLAAYPQDDDRWYEARFESLRVMRQLDFVRAQSAFDQFVALYPSLGPAPWNAQIADLFGVTLPGGNP